MGPLLKIKLLITAYEKNAASNGIKVMEKSLREEGAW